MRNILVNHGIRYEKIALVEDMKLVDFYVEDNNSKNLTDNIYVGKVKDVLKNMDSVFVDIGLEKNAYLQIDNAALLPKIGQKVLLQVLKDEAETKGAACTMNLSLAGRYIVLIINKTGKNLPKSNIMFSNDFDKESIKEIKDKISKSSSFKEHNVIIRHEAINASFESIIEDYNYLIAKYNSLVKEFEEATMPKLLYKKSIIDVLVNEFYDNSISEIIIDDEKIYNDAISKFNTYLLNSDKLRLYNDESIKLYDLYKINDELKKCLGKYVWLKHGGQLIIEHTEALTVIDVNTSKTDSHGKLENTVLKTNKDAAVEIARQIRLRNISGIIIVDFINMNNENNKNEIIKLLKEEVKKDKLKVHVLGFTKLCLLEMTRQKKRKMLKDIIKNQ